MPVWSSNKACHPLSRTGNRQLNAALHRVARTQAIGTRRYSNDGTPKAGDDSRMEALRWLKRRLSDVVYAALRADLAVSADVLAA